MNKYEIYPFTSKLDPCYVGIRQCFFTLTADTHTHMHTHTHTHHTFSVSLCLSLSLSLSRIPDGQCSTTTRSSLSQFWSSVRWNFSRNWLRPESDAPTGFLRDTGTGSATSIPLYPIQKTILCLSLDQVSKIPEPSDIDPKCVLVEN